MAKEVSHNGDKDKANVSSETLAELIKRIPELAAARDYGVDIRMLQANLNRPVIERIRRHQIALDTFEKLRGAKQL
jgi:3-dehydroquinate dehydratase